MSASRSRSPVPLFRAARDPKRRQRDEHPVADRRPVDGRRVRRHRGGPLAVRRERRGRGPHGRSGGRRARPGGRRARRRDLAAHPRPRADAHPAARPAELADERTPQIAATISAENGKTITEATAEAGRSGDLIRLSAFEGTQLYGDTLPLDANKGTGFDKIGFTVRQPVGVVVAITPFNFPSLLVLHKIAPGAGGRERGRPQAGPQHPADRTGAGGLLRRRRSARGRAVGADRPGWRARRPAGGRPAGAEGVVHRLDRHRRAHRGPGRGEEAVAGARRVLPGRDHAGRRPGAGVERGRPGRFRQRRPGLHLGAAGDRASGDQR